MKQIRIIIATIVLTGFVTFSCTAQNQTAIKDSVILTGEDHLNGLKKAGEDDIDPSQKIMFDGESIPVYTVEGKRIKGMEMMELMMSGDYIPEPYINENKEIKAFVLRPSTDEEKIEMQQMRDKMEGKSELAGKDAIPFSVTDLNRNKYSLQDLKGKVIVLNFWFVECKPCVMEIPELNKLVEHYKGKDIVFLGFATNDKSKLNSFLEKKEFDYNIIPESMDVINSYGINSFPTHVIIDKNSKITFSTSGLGPTTISDLENEINRLLNE